MKSFKSWDQTEIVYQEWGEQTDLPREAIPEAALIMLSGDHIEAIADPNFARSIVDFLA